MNSFMKYDSRLSSTLHVLLHMAHAEQPLTSEALAKMLHTNPVVVRRTLAGLRERGFVAAEKGHGGGWTLAKSLESLTLYDVYEALGEPTLFALGHRSDRPECLVEQAVNAAINETLGEAEALIVAKLRAVTLSALYADCAQRLPMAHKTHFHGTQPASAAGVLPRHNEEAQ
jgi:Rrf2 family protein